MSTHEIERKIRELRELQALIEEAEQEVETIKDAIKAHMGAQEELRAGEYRVTWKSIKSLRIDSSALKRTMPDIYAAFARENEVRRFCVV